VIHVLQPLTNQTTITSDPKLNITHPSPSVNIINGTILDINFGYVQNYPTPLRTYRDIEIILKFKSQPQPLILSGRGFIVTGEVLFGNDQRLVLFQLFNIVGPLLKPLLEISKTVKVCKDNV